MGTWRKDVAGINSGKEKDFPMRDAALRLQPQSIFLLLGGV